MEHEFRPCVAGDKEWAYALKREAYREVVERQFGPWDEERQRGMFVARWKPEISRIVVVGGVDAGLLATQDRDDCLWIDEIQIAREWRARGLGTAIVRELLAKAQAAGKPLRLQVLRENHRAKHLYLRLGFPETGETQTHFLMEHR